MDTEYLPSANPQAADQVALYESSGGTDGTTMKGLPVVIITMRGAKSGKIRKTPLMRVEHDGSYAAVASKGGAPENPVWYNNLTAHPEMELQDGPKHLHLTAREVFGAERDTWWQRAVSAFPDYANYATKTPRKIPVFVLEPTKS